jgi:hypothetical protein
VPAEFFPEQQREAGVFIYGFLNEFVSSGLDYVGAAIFVVGALCLIATAFQKSTGWGIAMLLFGVFVWPFFVLLNWKAASYWFFFTLVGFLIIYIF